MPARPDASRGYHGVSVRDITTEVGIKPASMYAHFPSKEHLLVELMRLGHEHALHTAREAIAALGPNPSPTDQLTALVRSQVRMNAAYPMLSRVCVNELRGLSPANLGTTFGLRMEGLTMLLDILRAGRTTGEFELDDVFLTAMASGGMILRVSGWYSGNESGLEFGPVLPQAANPAGQYPIDRLADSYAEFALLLVRRHR